MPTYLYVCQSCEARTDAYRKIDERDDCPECPLCFGETERRITATMVAVFNPYTTVVHDKETGQVMHIRNQDEHRAFLARNGYEEVGNDKSCAPLPMEEHLYRQREARKAAAAEPVFDLDESTHEATL